MKKLLAVLIAVLIAAIALAVRHRAQVEQPAGPEGSWEPASQQTPA